MLSRPSEYKSGALTYLFQLVQNLQHNLEDEQGEKSEILQDKEKIQIENEQLRNYQATVEDEKKSLQNEVEELRDELRSRSFTHRGKIEERDMHGNRLQLELDQIRQEYDDLQLLHQEKCLEAQRLKTRLEQMNGDFDGEFQALQKVSIHQHDSVSRY